MKKTPRPGAPLRDLLRSLRPAAVRGLLADLGPEELEAILHDWTLWGRPEQQLPPGGWRVWLLITGRGWGKTRTLSEAVRVWAQDPGARIAVVGRTAADSRDVLVEGPAGILSVFPARERPTYMPSVRRVLFKSGAVATTYSSEEADQLRGPSHTHAIADEVAAWQEPEAAWSNLQLTLRLGAHPRVVAATTPRPIPLLRSLMASRTTVVTRGRTADNFANLAPSAVEEFYSRWGGTRLGRQELEGELLWDTPGALWNAEILDRTRVKEAPADLQRIVIGVDPATTANEGSDLTGVVACGRDERGHVYVLRDVSLRASPDGWARTAINLFDELRADRIVVEKNAGGDMCEATLRTVRRDLPITMVHASRGKVTRAEPVAALWEQAKAHIVGSLPELEEEFCAFAPGAMEHSPDRADAAIWGIFDLMKGQSGAERTRALVGAAPMATRGALPAEIAEAALRAARAVAAYGGADFSRPEKAPGVRLDPPSTRPGPRVYHHD